MALVMINKNFDKISKLIDLDLDEDINVEHKLIKSLMSGEFTSSHLMNFACSKNHIKLFDFLLNQYDAEDKEKVSLYNIAINNKINKGVDSSYFYSILKSIPKNNNIGNLYFKTSDRNLIYKLVKRISLLDKREYDYFDEYCDYNFYGKSLKYSIINENDNYFNEKISKIKSSGDFNSFSDVLFLNDSKYVKMLFKNLNLKQNLDLKNVVENAVLTKYNTKNINIKSKYKINNADLVNFFNSINYKLEIKHLHHMFDDLNDKKVFDYISSYELSELKKLIDITKDFRHKNVKEYLVKLEDLYNHKEKSILLDALEEEINNSSFTRKRKV